MNSQLKSYKLNPHSLAGTFRLIFVPFVVIQCEFVLVFNYESTMINNIEFLLDPP